MLTRPGAWWFASRSASPEARAAHNLPCLRGCGATYWLFAELDTHNFRHTLLLHRHAVHHRRRLHRALVMRDQDELRGRAHLLDHVREASDVGLIERRVHLVEDAEWARLILEDAHQQRECGECLLAAGEQQHVLKFLARGRGNDVDTAFRGVLGIRQAHKALPTAEQLREG